MRSLFVALMVPYIIASTFALEGAFDYRPRSIWSQTCSVGKKQSPINIETDNVEVAVEDVGRVAFGTMGSLSAYTIFFTGISMEIAFDGWATEADVRIPANAYTIGNSTTVKTGDMLAVEPLQMHFHTFSEHTIDGLYAPGEIHIVTRVKDGESDYCDQTGGCLAVFGILTVFKGDGNRRHKIFDRFFREIPLATGMESGIPVTKKLCLDDLLPSTLDYYTYMGSLTTPPCSETVTWHVFKESIPIAAETIEKHQMMVSFIPGPDCTFSFFGVCSPPREKTNCRLIQPLFDRVVYLVEEELDGQMD